MTHFAPFTFRPRDRTLWRGTTPIPLTPKAAALLACLLEARGAWVSKEAILAAVWPDTHVQPENIKVLVREIRHALGDSTDAPAFIRSLPRHGYAFIAPIADRPAEPAFERPLASCTRVFVPRRPEIAALTAAVAAAPGSPRIALVTADHGGGKTALCDAFLRTVRASSLARICHSQCSDRELEPESFYPILDALVRLDRQHPGAVQAALAEHAPSWLALFPQWTGSSRRRESDSPSMLEQFRAAITALARDVPLVVVLDDVQWADADTVRALQYTIARRTTARAMFVLTCNEGAWVAGADARQRTAALPGALSIVLPPLTRDQVGQYIAARFGPGPLTRLAPSVYVATGGNPLLVATAFDGLIERRMIGSAAGGWAPASPIAAIARALPETLADMVSRQLELLELHEREAIEAAAAVGFEFTPGDVAIALGSDERTVDAIVGPLARRGRLVVAGGTGGDVYRFRHAFYVEVIARRAPQLRQRAFAARVAGRRAARRRAT